MAAWKDSGSNTIDAASFNLTTGWTFPITISTGTSSDQVDVCCFRNGDAIAVWVQDGQVFTSAYTLGTGLSSSTEQIGIAAGTITLPKVTCADSSTAVAIWVDTSGANNVVRASTFSPNAWTATQLITTGAVDYQLPAITCDSNGNAMAVFAGPQFQPFYVVYFNVIS
ncbi:MAG: hypothetical protein HRU43_06295 [Simkaniaceae bacterium]|nr:hypothetical protein [Simkaniaceae bacterium]